MTQIDTIETFDDLEGIARHAARWIEGLALASSGPFAIALSGGSTPKRLYEILAADHAGSMPWSRVHVFFGDERFVPADHADSNYRMAREALLDHVDVPAANVHPIQTDGTVEAAAARYQDVLQAYYRSDALDVGRPLFDVVLLGLGENGHTASLFPGTPVLEDTLHWVARCTPLDAPNDRITLTYPAISSSREVAFLVAGGGKKTVLAEVLDGDRTHPSSRITSIGRVNWFVDRAAAGKSA